MRLLLVGSGGREHALAWKLAQSPMLDELHAAPGNPGIASVGTCHPVRADDGEALLALAGSLAVDLVAVGPEAPLVAGLADALRRAGIAVFGPSAAAARIEGSKRFAKEVLNAAGVPTARLLTTPEPPCVVKLDGLAAGKGVFVCHDDAELEHALHEARRAGGDVLVEELLEGTELSLLVLSDGRNVVALPAAQDYKRLEDGDAGPNTGGMGSFSPVPNVDGAAVEELVETVHRPVLAELAARGTPFVGVLYAGLMRTDAGPLVLEFNCRFGDPETQSIVARLDGDLLAAVASAAAGDVDPESFRAGDEAAVTVVVAGGRYPESGDVGTTISGIGDAEALGALVFHAGTALRDGAVVTNGGRVLNVTATGASLPDARNLAYASVERISFAGARYRSDIAAVAERARA